MVFTSGYCIAKLQATRANSKADRLGVGKVKCRPAFGSTAQKTLAVPHRSYSLSRRASRPGCAGETGRTSACSVTGFSSRHTTGSVGSYGFSYVARTSSILAMYSSSSSATHHIFFPPRLEVVVQQQNPDGFSSHAGNQTTFHRLLRHQTHRPTRAPFGWIAAHHGDDFLSLTVVQETGGAWVLPVIKRGIQAVLPVATAKIPDGLCGEREALGNLGCTDPLGQLQQRQSAQDYPDLLQTTA